jgi:hypothetical protein
MINVGGRAGYLRTRHCDGAPCKGWNSGLRLRDMSRTTETNRGSETLSGPATPLITASKRSRAFKEAATHVHLQAESLPPGNVSSS